MTKPPIAAAFVLAGVFLAACEKRGATADAPPIPESDAAPESKPFPAAFPEPVGTGVGADRSASERMQNSIERIETGEKTEGDPIGLGHGVNPVGSVNAGNAGDR
ncbi:MAG: hypothetical protein KDM91_01385 [Verrucomicrobiae bacterium]|nr:hypothetical protein [Verrucomicrobiae bacterium]MCP5549636.1 hypothetical protein [Akkermansiaceae bacterium]